MAAKSPSFTSSTDSEDSGKLGEISGKLEPRTGKVSLAGRCHMPPHRLEHDYTITSKVLGSGYNGKVHLAKSRINSKQTAAVKTFRLKGLNDSKKDRLMAETSVFLCMDHPHVARLLDVYESDHHISLVMECMDGGELFDRVTSAKRFEETAAADATRQMLLALHYLHSHGMVHRDLKLENFLYDCAEGNHLKMIDFGFSKFSDSRVRMKTSCGTLAYVAPEVLKKNYTSQCDLWSMGVIVFVLLSGRMPFHGNSEEQMLDIKKGKYTFKPEYWSNVSEAGQEFTKALLELDPAKRLTSKMALDHQWLKQSFKEATPLSDSSVMSALRSWSLAPKLQRGLMSMMAWSLSSKHHAQVRDHFLVLDKNHDGAISFDELWQTMGNKNDCKSEGEVWHIFDLLTNKSQTCRESEIRYSDFLAAMACSHFELDDELLQVTFKKFDRSGSGCITAKDLRSILGDNFAGDDMDVLIQEGDLNADGKLDYDEFAKYIRSSRADLIAQRDAGVGNCITSESLALPPLKAPILLGRQSSRPLKAARPEKAHAVEVPTRKKDPACCVVQ